MKRLLSKERDGTKSYPTRCYSCEWRPHSPRHLLSWKGPDMLRECDQPPRSSFVGPVLVAVLMLAPLSHQVSRGAALGEARSRDFDFAVISADTLGSESITRLIEVRLSNLEFRIRWRE